MDKVQFQLESTLPELKDLYEKGLFTKSEINQITRRRTALETSLVRRVTRKEDFFKYAEYEINLERLRKVRYRKLKYHLNPPPPSASTYSLPRRTVYILKRATAKFPGDLAVWLAYVEYASREGMRKVVLQGLNSALQHHPLSPTLYLLMSYAHLHPNSPFPGSTIPSTSKLDLPSASARGEDDDDDDDAGPQGFSLEGTSTARTTLLLGIRLVPKSPELWREYIKLELGWVEGLRRRWKVLGVNIEPEPTAAAAAEGGIDPNALTGGEGSFGPDGEDARKAILSGQLVVNAITQALEAIPAQAGAGAGAGGMEFREALLEMLRVYPSALRSKALDAVYADLEVVASGQDDEACRARLIILTKGLYDRPYNPEVKDEGGMILGGVELVEEVGRIGKGIKKAAKSAKSPAWSTIAADWLFDQMDQCADNAELRQYLFSIVSTLSKSAYNPSPSLLVRHLTELKANTDETGSAALLKTARSHASLFPSNPSLQRDRLALEYAHSDLKETKTLAQQILKLVTVPGQSPEHQAIIVDMWLTQMDNASDGQLETNDTKGDGIESLLKTYLRESLRGNIAIAVPRLHSALLWKYFNWCNAKDAARIYSAPAERLGTIGVIRQKIIKTYQPDQTFFGKVFDHLVRGYDRAKEGKGVDEETNVDEALENVAVGYRLWKENVSDSYDKIDACLNYAEFGLMTGQGKKAVDAVDVLSRELGGKDEVAKEELKRRWMVLLEEVELRREEMQRADAEAARREQATEADDDAEMEGGPSGSNGGKGARGQRDEDVFMA